MRCGRWPGEGGRCLVPAPFEEQRRDADGDRANDTDEGQGDHQPGWSAGRLSRLQHRPHHGPDQWRACVDCRLGCRVIHSHLPRPGRGIVATA